MPTPQGGGRDQEAPCHVPKQRRQIPMTQGTHMPRLQAQDCGPDRWASPPNSRPPSSLLLLHAAEQWTRHCFLYAVT